MGDVKPPSGGTGDSSVLLLIHGSGSTFSEALQAIFENPKGFNAARSKASRDDLIEAKWLKPRRFPIEKESAVDRGWSVFVFLFSHTRSDRRRRKRNESMYCKERI